MSLILRIKEIKIVDTPVGKRVDISLPNGVTYHFGGLQKVKAFADRPLEQVKTSQLKIWKLLQALRDSGITANNLAEYTNRDITVSDVEVL